MPEIADQILALSEAELDAFPLGVIRVDRNGNILGYNRAEASLARRDPATTIGLNFFRDVAPCTAVSEFQGVFEQFVSEPDNLCEQFRFVFPFAWGSEEVAIAMVRRAGDEASFSIVVSALRTRSAESSGTSHGRKTRTDELS